MDTNVVDNTEVNLSRFRMWPKFHRDRQLLILKRKLVGERTRIFTMGSCFASEIRHALVRKGKEVFPNYGSVDFNKETQLFARFPDKDAIGNFDTFNMLQEFEAAFGI